MVKPLFCLFTNFFIYGKILNTKDYNSLLFNGKKGDDNGRILITRGYTNVTITELDFKIIDGQYEWTEIYFNDIYKVYIINYYCFSITILCFKNC